LLVESSDSAQAVVDPRDAAESAGLRASEVLNSYLDGNLILEIKSQAESELQSAVGSLKPEEAAVLAMLRGRLAREAEQPASANANASSGKRRGARRDLRAA